MKRKCECADPLCPVHRHESKCEQKADETLYRSDMDDQTGVRFCPGCAEDAFESGVFTTAQCDDDLDGETES